MLKGIIQTLFLAAAVFSFTMIVYIAVAPKEGGGFTEFYLLGPDGSAYYPTNLSAGQNMTLGIGIVNRENIPMSYLLLAQTDNKTILEKRITLSSEEKTETLLTFAPQAGRRRTDFLLYRPGEEAAYRSLRTWTEVEPDG
jgi:uncharacterized membrane protein